VTIVVIQDVRACHYHSVLNLHMYISVFKTYIWLTKTNMLYFCDFISKKMMTRKYEKTHKKLWKNL